MRIKWIFFIPIALVLFVYTVSLILSPTEIIYVQREGYRTDIVVKNLPFTDRGRIAWWKKNEAQLKLKYNTPVLGIYDGDFEVSIWNVGNGYQKEVPKQNWMFPSVDTSYLICFDNMKTDINCIEKDRLFSISRYRDPWRKGQSLTDFSIENNTYRQYPGSQEIIKIDRDKNVTYQ